MKESVVEIYDTTLRDGAQGEGLAYSVEDKIKIARALDEIGVAFIEGGWPGANPKDVEFFERAKSLRLDNAKLAAFGSTRRANAVAADDAVIQGLLAAETPVVTIFGKSWDFHVDIALKTTLEENLRMIADTVSHLKHCGRRALYDAEHFFDGFRANSEYAFDTLNAALDAGAETIILCDTNGGSLPEQIAETVALVRARFPNAKLGIHCHNDSELAVANSLAAVDAGATHVQGVFNGDQSGVSNIRFKADELGEEFNKNPEAARRLLAQLKSLEHEGYSFEDAEASFRLLAWSALGRRSNFFEPVDYRVWIGSSGDPEAVVRVKVAGDEMHTASLGVGPAHALDQALRKALAQHYPQIARFHLIDFKVRILDGEKATAAKTRVHVETSDGERSWNTVGVAENIIAATWQAIVESIEYGLHVNNRIQERDRTE